MTNTNNENLRIRSVIEGHYAKFTIEQLTNNVTTLRSVLMTILGNLQVNSTAIAEEVSSLQTRLSAMMVRVQCWVVFVVMWCSYCGTGEKSNVSWCI